MMPIWVSSRPSQMKIRYIGTSTPTAGIILVESIHRSRSLVRLVGEKAMPQAEGIAMISAEQRRAAGDDDRVHREVRDSRCWSRTVAVVLRRPVEEQERRRRRIGLELRLEAGEHHPEDREEDDEAGRPADDGPEGDACGRGLAGHVRRPGSCRRCGRGRRRRCWRARPPRCRPPKPRRRWSSGSPAGRRGRRGWWSPGPARRRW